jgi:hypothetical protein
MCATVSWGAHESFIHPIFVLKNGCDRHQLVRDVVTFGAGAIIFKSATESCGLDQPVPGAKNFVRRAIGGCGLNQPDPGGTSFLSQSGTATIER